MEPMLGPHARTDRTRNTRVAVPRLPTLEDGRPGKGQRLTPDTPHNGGRPAPPGTAPHHPRGTQPPQGVQAKGTVLGPHTRTNGGHGARAAHPPPTRPSAHERHGLAPRGAHSPKPGREEPGPHRPPQAGKMEQGTGAGHAEGHGPRGTALPAPSAGTARGAHATPPRGGGSGRRGSVSAHTREVHAGTTRRATGPSSRNAQGAWNGVPASEGRGLPDGTARHTQRGTRGAGRGKRERHNTRYRPEPPQPAASAAHTRTGHCIRQGSSGALRHAPTPRQGSLRASPRESLWRQASSTGPAAPAPRATTH